MPLISKFKETIKRYQLVSKKDRIVIGVSGGPDSVCLLLLLKSLQQEFKLTLHIAHVNHMLRGKDSEKDAEFVRALSQRLNIPAACKAVDIATLTTKGSSEESARKQRFSFLFAVARKVKAKKIALGHTLDDQAETVMMRILRGSGLMGLSGILPKRKMGDFIIVRPLLEIPRNEIERFLKVKKVTPRIDATNLKDMYFRNRIRHKLLPELKKYNPNIKTVLANMAENLVLDYEYIAAKAFTAFKTIRKGKSKAGLTLILEKLLRVHPSLQNMVLRFSFEELKGDTRRLTFSHIKELNDLVSHRPYGSIVDLPSRISAVKNQKYLCVYHR